MARSLMLAFLFFLIGCGSRPDPLAFRPFEHVPRKEAEKSSAKEVPRFSLLAENMPFPEFVSLLVSELGLSVAYASSLDGETVSLNVLNQPIDQVLAVVARRLGVAIALQGSIYFLGDLKPDDRSTLVTWVPGLDKESLSSVLSLQVSEFGRYFCNDSGLVVIADRPEVLVRIASVFDELRAIKSGTWVVQLLVVALTDSQRKEFGLDVEHVASVAATVAGSIRSIDVSTAVNGSFRALLSLAGEASKGTYNWRPLFLVEPGFPAKYSDGELIPVPRRNVSSEGTVTVVGYDRIPTGSSFKVLLRESGAGAAVLEVDVVISDLRGFVGEAPITNESEFSTRTTIEGGGLYMLGEFQRRRNASTRSGPLVPTLFGAEDRSDSLTLWAQVIRL